MDEDIERTVHSLFGTSARVIDCEKSSSVTQEETLFINGIEIKCDGEDTAAIKTALLEGHAPSIDVLNQLLYQAGLLREPIEFETSLSVKSSLVTTEEVCVSKHGQVLDERSCETKEDHIYQSSQKEIWHPILGPNLENLSLKMVDDCHTFNRKEITEKQNTQKSATFAGIPNNTNNLSQKNFTLSDSEFGISESDCSTKTFSPNIFESNSAISSSSALTTTDRPTSSFTNCKHKCSNSFDSGHGGLFQSFSQCGQWNRNNTTFTGNSFSSCYDVASSSEELSNPTPQAKVIPKSQDELQYRKPQTTISLPLHSFIDENTVLRYANEILVSGPLDCLITHLVPTYDYSPANDFVFTFLLCSRIFLKPRELLAKIHSIWVHQQEFTLRTSKAKIASKLINFLAMWFSEFPYDFRDDNMMQEVRALTKKCFDIDQTLSKDISNPLQRLVDVLSALDKHEKEMESFTKTSSLERRSSENLTKSDTIEPKYNLMRSESQPITWHIKRAGNCFSTVAKVQALSVINICDRHVDLAHQLTAIELETLSYIGSEELLRSFLPEFQCYVFGDLRIDIRNTQLSINSPERTQKIPSCEKTRNLEAYVQWFNRLSYLTATEIVKCQKKKHRVQMIEYWIEVARECFNIGNFNSLMAILAGLNLDAVARLKRTWAKVKSAKFSVLEHQMDPSLNFSSYRSTMKAAVWRSEGATDERQRVVIPFFTLFLKDLYTLNEGQDNRLPNGHINFLKCANISKQAQDFNKWKRTRCPFEKLTNVQVFLQSSEIFNQNGLLLASFSCESPDNNVEKERHRMLRSVTN